MKLQILGISFLCASSAFCYAETAAKTTVPVETEKMVSAPQPASNKLIPEILAVSSAIEIPTPLFADVKNLQDKVFDSTEKLHTQIPLPGVLQYVPAQKNDQGFFVAPLSSETPKEDTLTVFRTFITPENFMRCTLNVKSPQKFEVWINGVKLADKLSVETDLAKSGSLVRDYNFEVNRYEIIVKVLSEKDSKLAPSVKIELEPKNKNAKTSLKFTNGKEPRPVTIADVNEVDRLIGVSVSPDGRYLLATYSFLKSDGNAQRRIEARDTETNELIFVEDASRSYAWMPKGSRLYFRRADPNDRCAFVEFDFATRKETVIAENLPNSNHAYTWLPDESGLIVSKTIRWTNESSDWKRVLNMADRDGDWRDRTFLYRYKLSKGIFEPLTAGSQSTGLLSISPDSQKLIFMTSKIDYTQPEYNLRSIYMLDLKTLKCEPLFEDEKYSCGIIAWSPDSKKAVVFGGPNSFDDAGLALPKGTIGNSYDCQAFIYDIATKKLDPITKNFNPSIAAAAWGGDGNIYFTTTDRDMENVYRYEPSTRKFTRLNFPMSITSSFNVQKSIKGFKPVAYAIGSDCTQFPKAYKIDLNTNVAQQIFAPTTGEDKLAMPSVSSWKFMSDGTEIDGHFFLPPNFDATKKYPMIVYYYSGTTPTSRVLGAHYPFPLYAAQGYVVYVINPSGAIGYGQEFSARHLNAWGRRTADDIITGVKKFCEAHPFVDSKKIGCIGASYGGFMTMYLQTRTDIFAAAVAHAGISDITSYWGEGMWGYAYNAIAAAGSFPWKDKDLFVDQSPLFSADKIKTPILLCHGVSDINVPVGESVQMFAALKLLGKPVELLTFTAEDHGIMNYKRRQQWMKSHLAWFSRWLKDDADWWTTLYPDKNW